MSEWEESREKILHLYSLKIENFKVILSRFSHDDAQNTSRVIDVSTNGFVWTAMLL